MGSTFTTSRTPASRGRLASVVCPGGQGDVSVHGNLLFMSVEQSRGRLDCGTRVFGDHQRRTFPRHPHLRHQRYSKAEADCRGADVPRVAYPYAAGQSRRSGNLYFYGSGTGRVRSPQELEGCSALNPEEDPNTALFSIDVIQVPLSAPEKARVVNRPRIFADRRPARSPGCGRAAITGPGRSVHVRRINATT